MVIGGSGAAVILGRGLCSTPRAVGSCLWVGVSAIRLALVCEGLRGLSCGARMANGGRQREVTCLSRENTWSVERNGHVCLNTPLKIWSGKEDKGHFGDLA